MCIGLPSRVLRADGVEALVQGREAVRRPIRLGAQSLSQVEVLEGLKPGERVVVNGGEHFKGAERITLAQ